MNSDRLGRWGGVVLLGTLGLLMGAPPAAAVASTETADPLFRRMEGRWAGEGRRVYAVSGRVVQVGVRTDARVVTEGGATYLISRNTFTESDQRGKRQYEREYWIRREPAREAAEDNVFSYELGAGPQAENRVTAHGILEGDIFRVDQVIPTQPPITVRSETVFEDDRTVYRDTAWLGERQNVESEIIYVRSDGTESTAP